MSALAFKAKESSVVGNDPYALAEGSLTLKNKLGVTNAIDLAQAELVLSSFRRSMGTPAGDYSWDHLKKVHNHLFQDVYEWAGEARETELRSSSGKNYVAADRVDSAMEYIFTDLAKEQFLFGLEQEEFTVKAASYYNRMNAVHPFRTGNGRAIRMFIEEMAKNNGLEFSWSKIDKKEWKAACVEAEKGAHQGLINCFKKVTVEHVAEIRAKTGKILAPGASSRSAAEKAIKLVSSAVKAGKGVGASSDFNADQFSDIPSKPSTPSME